jgi:PAS domain S-box-containing protein
MPSAHIERHHVAGFVLCLLSLFVLAGWVLGNETMVRVIPGSTAMAINTAAMLLLAGCCLSIHGSTDARIQAAYRWLAGLLVVFPLAIFSQHLFDIDLGIDWAGVHAALGDGHAKPGRTAPNACLGFTLAGMVLLIMRRRPRRPRTQRSAIVLAASVFLIGFTAFLGYLLNLEVLYQVASLNKMAALTAAGLTLVGAGCWSLAAGHRLPNYKPGASDATRITGLSAALLTTFAIAVGITAFGLLKNSYERSAINNIWHTASTSALGISTMLDKIVLLNQSVATRPSIVSSMSGMNGPGENPAALAALRREAGNFKELGFSSVQIFSAAGKLIVSSGNVVGTEADVSAEIVQSPDKGSLLWKDGFVFRTEHTLVDGERYVGKIVIERALDSFNAFMGQAQRVSQTGDLVLCTREGDSMTCFPGRDGEVKSRQPIFRDSGEPASPVARALLGESGSTSLTDKHGRLALMGYSPIPAYHLALVQQVDASELYLPLRENLPWLAGAVALFIAVGTLLLRKWVRPLVSRIASERRRMEAILDNTNDAFLTVSSTGVVTDWNAAAERLLGWTAAEATGRDFTELFIAVAERKARFLDVQRFLAEGPGMSDAGRRMEITVINRLGAAIPVEISAAPFHDGRELALGAFLRDLRPERAAEQELERARLALVQAQKLDAVGKLTGGVAHDFNNVLQVLKGSLQLIQLENENRYKVQARANTAMGAVERGAKLASQLLAFARKQPLQPAVINLGRVVRDMNDLLQRALGESIEVETVVSAGLWHTLIDPHQLEQVVLNLAINARDAMDGRGKLTLELGNASLDDDYVRHEPELRAGQYVMLAISDTGCGMQPHVAERAFEPFFTTKPEGKGTGLGLSMAYGFVKQSGGHIRIYTEAGHGTTIKIFLPRSHEKEDQVSLPRLEAVDGGKETILVVEDDLSVQATTIELLGQLGYTVLKADNADAALALIEQGARIDLLFTDVVMPGTLRSPELARLAAEQLPGLKVLFTSGYTQNAIVHGGRLDPGVHLLSKPYSREQLARKIRSLLDESKPLRAGQRPHDAEPVPHISHAAHATHAAHTAAHTAPQQASVAPRVAYVEDNDDLRTLGEDMLRIIGYDPDTFSCAEEALAALRSSTYSILVTDIGLPGMSGTELASLAVNMQPGLRVILASGFGDHPPAGAGFTHDVLRKPFNMEQLKAALQSSAAHCSIATGAQSG